MKKVMNVLVAGMIATAGIYAPVLSVDAAGVVKQGQTDYAGHPMKAQIEYVLKNRLMWAFSDGSFHPNQPVTQADLVVGLVAIKGLTSGKTVPDLPANHWAKAAYERAYLDGMLNGVKINPSKMINREEAAYLIINALQSVRNTRKLKDTEFYNKDIPNIQFVVGYRWLPKKAGKFTNGVTTSVYDGISNLTRAEEAYALNVLHVDLNEMSQANKLADEFHVSLKVRNGIITGKAVSGTNQITTEMVVIYKNNTSKIIKTNSLFNEDISQLARIVFSVATYSRKGLVEYRYDKFNPPTRDRRWY